jgi:hypothetical protein
MFGMVRVDPTEEGARPCAARLMAVVVLGASAWRTPAATLGNAASLPRPGRRCAPSPAPTYHRSMGSWGRRERACLYGPVVLPTRSVPAPPCDLPPGRAAITPRLPEDVVPRGAPMSRSSHSKGCSGKLKPAACRAEGTLKRGTAMLADRIPHRHPLTGPRVPHLSLARSREGAWRGNSAMACCLPWGSGRRGSGRTVQRVALDANTRHGRAAATYSRSIRGAALRYPHGSGPGLC